MKTLNTYITEQQIDEGLKDSLINIFNNLFKHGEVAKEESKTIEIDPKVFGKLVRDKEYFSPNTKEYPKLVPSITHSEDFWDLFSVGKETDKYGEEIHTVTHIGYADFRKDKHVIEVDKKYAELVEKVLKKYQS